jgi:hypothetical protein
LRAPARRQPAAAGPGLGGEESARGKGRRSWTGAAWSGWLPEGGRRPAAIPPITGSAVLLSYGLLLLAHAVRLGLTWNHTNGLARRALPLEVPEHAAPLVARCREILGIGAVDLLNSNEVAGPVTLGALRPAILLPPGFLDGAPPEEALSALGHEMAHVRRRDYAVNLLCEALLIPVAFHPAVRLVRRRLAEAREMACDEVVLETLIGRRSYARSLLSLAASIAGLDRPSYTLGVADGSTKADKRTRPVAGYEVTGNTLTFKVRVEDFKFRDNPPAAAEMRESLELQGGDAAVFKILSNSYFEAAKKRGEPVPPPPPPIWMKRAS